jgi:glycerate dehydrogenase
MEKIVVLDGYTLNPGDMSWDSLKAFGELTVYDRTPVSKVAERIGNSSIVFTNKTPLTKEVLDACPSIKYIGVLATGYNVVDYEYAKVKGIPVANVPAYGTDAVSQFAVALLLEICHHIGEHSKSVASGQWANSEDFCYWNYPLIELAGKTLGIIGMGRIGAGTARIAQAMGMNIIGYDSNINPALQEQGFKFVGIEELFKESDVISLHCPLFPETQGIINAKNISKMKDGVIIINTSRGPLVVEEDLAQALNSGKVYAAAVDVVSEEPIKKDNPLLGAKNCLITPHIAWAPIEARKRLMDTAVSNLERWLSGNPANIVNM